MSVTGEPATGRALKVGAALVDMTCGLYATVGVLGGLAGRERDGAGRHVEVSLMDSALAALLNQGAGYLAGSVPGRMGNRHPSIAPYETFATADDDIVVAAPNDAIFGAAVQATGRAGTRRRPPLHVQHPAQGPPGRPPVEIEAALKGASAAEWVARLTAAGVPAGPVNDIAQAYAFAGGSGSTRCSTPRACGWRARRCGSPRRRRTRRRPPRLGEHADEIRAWLSADSLPG